MSDSEITVTAAQFAQKLKEEHPQYANVADDGQLDMIEGFIQKNPQYRARYAMREDGTTLVSVSWNIPELTPAPNADLPAGAATSVSATPSSAPIDKPIAATAAEESTQTNSRAGIDSGTTVGGRYAARRAAISKEFGAAKEVNAARHPERDSFDEPVKYCAHCGQQNLEDYSFCMRCGQPFDQSDVVSTPVQRKWKRTSEQPSKPPAIVSTPEQSQRGIDQQMRSFDKSKLTTQQKLYFQQEYDKQNRNPSTALVLALLLGGLGAHRFYLGEMGWGVAYVLFSWTFIPAIVALIECFSIRNRTEKYNERCAEEILNKMAVIFSEPETALALR